MTVDQHRQLNEGDMRPSLEQQLRAAGKIPLEDRPIMAERLGEIAVEIHPQKPLHAIKQMWSNAWGEDQSFDKRKRLVRLPGEAGPTEYEAAAPKWCKLITAAAELLNQGEWNEPSGNKHEQVFRRVLRGTSFWPQNASLLQPGVSLAQELLETFNSSILTAVRQETGLLDLWAATAPGATEVVIEYYDDKNDLPEVMSAVEAAAQRASELPCVKVPPAREGARFSVERETWSDWMFPSVELGALIQSVRVPVFILPDGVAQHHDGWGLTGFEWGPGEEFGSDNGVVGEWFRSELATRGIGVDQLLQTEMGREFRYGWREVSAYKIHRLDLSLERRPNGEPVLWLKAYDTDQLVPESISAEGAYKRLLSGSARLSEFRGQLEHHYNWEQQGWMFYPSDEPDTSPQFLGFTEERQGRDLDCRGWLKGWFNGELSNDLLCYAQDVKFIPALNLRDDFPEAYPRSTPLGALLLNAVGPKEHRVSTILLEQTKTIVELGNGYLNALADHYRSAMII